MNVEFRPDGVVRAPAKFEDPDKTAAGEPRATVPLTGLDTLWINTGTLCNITCINCYIESSPTNDRLDYISAAEVAALLDEIADLGLDTREIGFTGGEPFMNPDMLGDAGRRAGARLRGARPDQRHAAHAASARSATGLLALNERYGARLTLRVSLDHYTSALHEPSAAANTWTKSIDGIDWLAENGFTLAIAGRTCWGESEATARAGYAALIAARGWPIEPTIPAPCAVPGDGRPRTTCRRSPTACWGILGKTPSDVMCATSRMVVKRKGAAEPIVLPCTLLPYRSRLRDGRRRSADPSRRRRRHVRQWRGQALPSPLRQVLRARRRQLFVMPRINDCFQSF